MLPRFFEVIVTVYFPIFAIIILSAPRVGCPHGSYPYGQNDDLTRSLKGFQPYWRPVNSKPGGGLRLGLYICAQIVKGHRGELRDFLP
jgi:hypothetical protein